MEGLNKHVSTLLLVAAIAVVGVSTGLYFVLLQFQEIQEGFNTDLPLWLSWVFPTYKYWSVIGGALFLMFIVSLKPSIRYLPSFNCSAVRASIIGFVCSVLFLVFSILAIYWPVMQNA
jgi:glucan phosphoethanolaminetransferase (alkaline phosphatase superfamily)